MSTPALRNASALVAALLQAAVLAFGQSVPPPLFSCPSPPRPPNFEYVGLDRGGNLVIRYPANLDNPRAKNPGQTVTMHVVLPNHVGPRIRMQVASTGGDFMYNYAISNQPTARQPITWWKMIMPIPAPILAAHGPGWTALKDVNPAPTDPNVPAYFPPPAYFLDWVAGNQLSPHGGAIEPGQARPGFTIVTPASPGFTRNYFQADGPNDPTHDMPNDAAQEVEYYMAIRHYAKEFRFLGPAFLPGTPPAEIARRLLKSTQWLACHGQLDQNSAFVRSAVDDLRGIARGTGPEALAAPPSTPMEIQLATALDLNDLARPRP